jgi:hypothetical protein
MRASPRVLRAGLITGGLCAMLLLQGCLAAAAVGAAGTVASTAVGVTVGAARVGGHVVASGARAVTGSGRHRDDEEQNRERR